MDEENLIGFFLVTYIILILVIGIVALIRRKWLPGAAMALMIIIPWGLTRIINWLASMIPSIVPNDQDWLLYLGVFTFTSSWFVIAWWFYKENAETPMKGALETA